MKIVWDDPAQTIIRVESGASWTWEEYRQATVQAARMIRGKKHRVDFVHFLRVLYIPESPFPEFFRALQHFPENTGGIVIVGGPAVEGMVAIFSRLYPEAQDRVFSAASLEEARVFLAARRGNDAAV